jgi:predicted transcriptional regulator
MNVVTLEIGSRDKSNRRFLSGMKGEAQGTFISFESPALLFRVYSGKRRDLLKVMAGAGPMTIREAARRAGRDVKAVHRDIQFLLKVGILAKEAMGALLRT